MWKRPQNREYTQERNMGLQCGPSSVPPCTWQPIFLIFDSPITRTNKKCYAKNESISLMVTFSSIQKENRTNLMGIKKREKIEARRHPKLVCKWIHAGSARMCACVMWVEGHPTIAKRKCYSTVMPMESWIPLCDISNISTSIST